jgi:hypothetical protein
MKSTYTIRTLRLYKPETFPNFVSLCRDNYKISATAALNQIITEAVKNGKLPLEDKGR